MKIYYLEFENSVKFFRNDTSIEIEKSKLLELFLNAVYKKYGKKVKFECLVWKKKTFIFCVGETIKIINVKLWLEHLYTKE